MKYNIHINQKTIVDNKIDIDLKDAVILEFLKSMPLSEKIKKIILDNRVYFWVNYKYLLKENPLLGIKAVDSLYRRMAKLVSVGLLDVHPDNQKLNRGYYSFTKKFYELFESSDEKYEDYDFEPTDEKSEVPTDEKSDDNSIYIFSNTNKLNYTIKNNKEEKKEKKIFRKFLHLSITEEDISSIKELGYSDEQIKQTLDDIENYKKNTQYRSLNLTLRKWLKKNYPNVKPIDEQTKLNLEDDFSADNFYSHFR